MSLPPYSDPTAADNLPVSIAGGQDARRDESVREVLSKRFFHECSGVGGLFVAVQRPGSQQRDRVSLTRPYLLVGSDPRCDVHIDSPLVSPVHTYLQWIDGSLYCCDLATENGTCWGDERRLAGWWSGWPPLVLGNARLMVTAPLPKPETEVDPMARRPEFTDSHQQIRLKFLGAKIPLAPWPILRPLSLIGREPPCKVKADHPSVDRVHAAIVRTDKSCWLVDLSVTGETLVNGRQVHSALLARGDIIRLGEFELEVEVVAAGAGAAAGKPHLPRTTPPFRPTEAPARTAAPIGSEAPDASTMGLPSIPSGLLVSMKQLVDEQSTIVTELLAANYDPAVAGLLLATLERLKGIAASQQSLWREIVHAATNPPLKPR